MPVFQPLKFKALVNVMGWQPAATQHETLLQMFRAEAIKNWPALFENEQDVNEYIDEQWDDGDVLSAFCKKYDVRS